MRLINLLNLKERRLLIYAGLFLLIVILFIFFIVRGQINAHLRSEEILASKKQELLSVKESLAEKKKELMRWKEAVKDLEYLNDTYFYAGKISIHQIRMDLNKLFERTGVEADSIKYEYNENKDEKIKKISMSFDIAGTYALIKKFLFEIENLEKFLYVEKITFKDIERERGRVQLGLSLAVYHET
jgi:Tfp pilus assembly protein PilO